MPIGGAVSIPALGGGGANQALQRALMDAAERALADDLQLLSRPGTEADAAGPRAEAIVVELADAGHAEDLTVAGGWITTPRQATLPAAAPAAVPVRMPPAGPEAAADSARGAAADAAPRTVGPGGALALDRLLALLKQTGIDFRDAVQVLREIRPGEPLPTRAELKALWAAAPTGSPSGKGQAAAVPVPSTPADIAVDHLVRERGWNRAESTSLAGTHAGDRGAASPTLATVTQPTALNQAYVAGLSTAEFQRLVTVLGADGAPAWFWRVRGHAGLRALAERPVIARLNATRFAGTRLSAWLLALVGMTLLWYVGFHAQIWW